MDFTLAVRTRGRGGREKRPHIHSLFGGEQQKRTFPFIDHQSRGGDRTVNLADHRLYNPQPSHAIPVPDSDSGTNYRARYRYHHDNRETAIKPYPLNCAAKKHKTRDSMQKSGRPSTATRGDFQCQPFLLLFPSHFLPSLCINLSFGLQRQQRGRPTQQSADARALSLAPQKEVHN